MDKRGKFIVFDGGEGSGKTTMSKKAVAHLEERHIPVVWTREPGGSPFAEKIRELILSEGAKHADAETMFALFWAARRDHLHQTVIPALNRGAHVICDRFDSSTWAYQIVAQNQPQLRERFWQIREHYLGETVPDCYILFLVDPEVGLTRAKRRRAEEVNHFDERDIKFHRAVGDGFREFVESKKASFRAVNANVSEDEVAEQMFNTLRGLGILE